MAISEVPNKDIRALLERRLKPELEVVHDNAGHFEIHENGEAIRNEKGQPLKLPGTPHGGRALKNLEKSLEAAGVFKENGQPAKPRLTVAQKREAKERMERVAETVRERERNRQAEMEPIRQRYKRLFEPMGGVHANMADLTHAIVQRGREAGIMSPREGQPLTPDLVRSMLITFDNGGWVTAPYREALNLVADELDSDDPIESWFALVREVRGLPEVMVEEMALVDEEWPFRVERLPLKILIADHAYQRPVAWPFVRAKAASFDASLVGVIDVAERRRGAIYAIMDGQQRSEMMRLVGKETVWCSIYSGLDVAAEARFFLHKNRDVRAIHPFYTFQARLTAQDPDALSIEKISKAQGYKLSLTSAKPGLEANISAIGAVQVVHGLSNEVRSEQLSATLALLRETTFGLEQGQSALLIRGLGNLLHVQPEVDLERLQKVLGQTTPTLWIARGRERAGSGSGVGHYISRVLQEEYNKGLSARDKLKVRV